MNKFKLDNIPSSFYISESIGYKFGKSSFLLMNSVMYKYTQNEKYFTNIEIIISEILSQIETNSYGERNYEELCDFIRVLYVIEKMDIIESNDIISLIEKFLLNVEFFFQKYLLKGNDFHFCRGILVFGNLFIETPSYIKNYDKEKKMIVNFLNKISYENEYGKYWINTNKAFENKIFSSSIYGNLSVCKFLKKNINNCFIAKSLLISGINFVLKQMKYNKKGLSTFDEPTTQSSLLENSKKPILQWVDGSLNILYSLVVDFKEYLTNKEYNFILNNLIHIANFKEEDVNCPKTSIGYGSTGVFLMFRKLYKVTNIDVFNQSYKYWYNLTKERIKFKEQRFSEYKDDIRLTGFITGYTGVYTSMILCEKDNEAILDNLIYI